MCHPNKSTRRVRYPSQEDSAVEDHGFVHVESCNNAVLIVCMCSKHRHAMGVVQINTVVV